jgi:hypothetical protein
MFGRLSDQIGRRRRLNHKQAEMRDVFDDVLSGLHCRAIAARELEGVTIYDL